MKARRRKPAESASDNFGLAMDIVNVLGGPTKRMRRDRVVRILRGAAAFYNIDLIDGGRLFDESRPRRRRR